MRICESVSDVRLADPPQRLEAHNVALLDGVRSGPDRAAALCFALEQRMFGLGLGRAGAARAWYRRFEWIQTRRRLGLPRALIAIIKRPARVVREAWRTAAVHGPAVRVAHGVSLWMQRLQISWLGLRRGIDPESYYEFWLFRPERRRVAHLYVQKHEAGLLYRVLAVRDAMDDFYITEDKRLFERWCRDHALPTVRTIAEFADGALTSADAFVTLPPQDLFSKPIDSFGGAGARRWRYSGRGSWQSLEDTCDRAALVATLAKQSRSGGILLQECLENDPRIVHLSSGSLCTVRIVTIRPPGGEPEMACAVFRMPTGGNSTDNFSIAGIAAHVDLTTGCLGTAVRKDPHLVVAPVRIHPDTEAAIEGAQLPWWTEATALALSSHRKLPTIACVGWDIALTGAGPVLVEANWAPGAKLAQAPSGIPLGATNFVRYLEAHMRRSFTREPRRVNSS